MLVVDTRFLEGNSKKDKRTEQNQLPRQLVEGESSNLFPLRPFKSAYQLPDTFTPTLKEKKSKSSDAIDLTSPVSSFGSTGSSSARNRVDALTAEAEEMVQRIQARCVRRAGYTRTYDVDQEVVKKTWNSPSAKKRLVALSEPKNRQVAVDVYAGLLRSDPRMMSPGCSDVVSEVIGVEQENRND